MRENDMISKRTWFLICMATMVSAVLGGCIPLEDLGQYWDKGVIDSQLEGHWKMTDPNYGHNEASYISFIRSGDHYEEKLTNADEILPAGPNQSCKSLYIGKGKFLMFDVSAELKKMEEAAKKLTEEQSGALADANNIIKPSQKEHACKGGLMRYAVDGKTLTFYNIDLSKLRKAVLEGRVRGFAEKDANTMPNVVLGVLDESILKFIESVVDEEAWWQHASSYTRITDIDKAVKESRTYPATPQTSQNTLAEIRIPEFEYFARGKTDTVLRMLEAMPEWKVVKEGDEIVSYRRFRQYDSWDEGSNGYLSNWENVEDNNDMYQIRYMFRFSKEPFGFHAVWAQRPHVMKLDPMAGKINAKIWDSSQGLESYLAIGQEGLWFEFFEQTKKEPRTYTREAINWLAKFFKDLQATEKEINTQGYTPTLMDPNSVKTGKASIQIEKKGNRTILKAWVNPQEHGQVSLKVYDISNGKPLMENFQYGTKEFIGWSKNGDTLFSYEYSLSGLPWPEKIKQVRLELWFMPESGSSERKLLETIYAVKQR